MYCKDLHAEPAVRVCWWYYYYTGLKLTYCRENTEALVVAGKEIDPEVNADKTKYRVVEKDGRDLKPL